MVSAAVADTFASLKAGLDARAAGRIVDSGGKPVSSGFAELDRALAGGFIRGSIATLEGGAGCSGRTAILAAALASATRCGLAAAIHDGTLYPPDLERAGVVLDRLLLVCANSPIASARCADILLRSRVFSLVTLPAVHVRGTVWSRLGALAKKSDALLLTLGQASTELGYFASTRVRCAIDRIFWTEGNGVLRELAGYEICTQVFKHRRSAPGAVARLRIA
ncbi:MAG TPA: hypothetical protein VFW34_01025 [Candidatus Rubrimentiphilum sp.]|nr:hypothetical protein [Candidatus Rubrimentiphilum sp.]